MRPLHLKVLVMLPKVIRIDCTV